MNVNRIDNNTNFGFKIKLKGKNIDWEQLVNYRDTEYAKKVLDEVDKYMPEHTVELSVDWHRPLAQDWIIAKNLTTGVTGNPNLDRVGNFASERIYPMNWDNGRHDNRSLYILLKRLMNSKDNMFEHEQFWDVKVPSTSDSTDVSTLMNHSVFDVKG